MPKVLVRKRKRETSEKNLLAMLQNEKDWLNNTKRNPNRGRNEFKQMISQHKQRATEIIRALGIGEELVNRILIRNCTVDEALLLQSASSQTTATMPLSSAGEPGLLPVNAGQKRCAFCNTVFREKAEPLHLVSNHLSECNPQEVSFAGAALSGVHLKDAKLDGYDFSTADLRGADLRNTSLVHTSFENADLTNADLSGANIDCASFKKANLDATTFHGVLNLKDWGKFAGAHIAGSTLKIPKHLLKKKVKAGTTAKSRPDHEDAKRSTLVRLVIHPDNERFGKIREWIDTCLDPPKILPQDLYRPLTSDAKTLLDAIDDLEKVLPLNHADPDVDKIVRFRLQVLKKRRESIVNCSVDGRIVGIRKLNWRLLAPDEIGLEQLVRILQSHTHNDNVTNVRIELERIEKILGLRPSKIYVGRDEFAGYVVFLFDATPIAVLDNPVVGNALYLLRGDWQSLSHRSKTELLRMHAGHAERIIHAGDWFGTLRQQLHL